MSFNSCTYDFNPVPITYTSAELNVIINNYISNTNSEFNFNELCSFILDKAKQEKKVKDAENVEYSSSELRSLDSIRVSRILWDHIWNKEIIIAFGDNRYRSCTPGTTRFIKTDVLKEIL